MESFAAEQTPLENAPTLDSLPEVALSNIVHFLDYMDARRMEVAGANLTCVVWRDITTRFFGRVGFEFSDDSYSKKEVKEACRRLVYTRFLARKWEDFSFQLEYLPLGRDRTLEPRLLCVAEAINNCHDFLFFVRCRYHNDISESFLEDSQRVYRIGDHRRRWTEVHDSMSMQGVFNLPPRTDWSGLFCTLLTAQEPTLEQFKVTVVCVDKRFFFPGDMFCYDILGPRLMHFTCDSEISMDAFVGEENMEQAPRPQLPGNTWMFEICHGMETELQDGPFHPFFHSGSCSTVFGSDTKGLLIFTLDNSRPQPSRPAEEDPVLPSAGRDEDPFLIYRYSWTDHNNEI